MDAVSKQKLIWGWLRIFLGWLQMSSAAAAIGALFTVGLQPITYAFLVAATAATLTSRLLYHGQRGPTLKGTHTDDKTR